MPGLSIPSSTFPLVMLGAGSPEGSGPFRNLPERAFRPPPSFPSSSTLGDSLASSGKLFGPEVSTLLT
eukprot:1195507-Prorocentrum_minimum.AAC.3